MDENQTQEQPVNTESNVTAPEAANNSTDNSKTMAIVAYFIFFLPLLTEYKNNAFVKYHVKQSILLDIIWVAAAIISSIPFIGNLLGLLITMGLFVLWIMGIINASSSKTEPVPVIGKYAEELLKF